MKYLYILQQALIWVITIFWVYQIAISICSFIKLKDKPLLKKKNHKFMAIIPAPVSYTHLDVYKRQLSYC